MTRIDAHRLGHEASEADYLGSVIGHRQAGLHDTRLRRKVAGERDTGLIFVEQASASWIVTVSSESSSAMRSKRSQRLKNLSRSPIVECTGEASA